MKKVLILTASYGSGHVVVAKALDEAFRKKGIEPTVFDLVLEGGRMEKNAAAFYEFLMKRGHFAWHFFQEKIMTIRKGDSIRKIYEMLHRGKFFKDIKKVNPDIIVATMDTASLVASLYKRENPNVKIYTVITDYVAHPLWIWKNMDGFFVGSPELKTELVKSGIDKEKVTVSGIPVRSQFEQHIEKEAARKKLGIPAYKLVILISAGSFGSVPVNTILESIPFPLETFAIVLAGRRPDLVSRYAQMLREHDVIGRIVEFTEDVNEYMSASDLFISKAGGISVAECFACSLPAVYANNFPGHEMGNAKYAQKNGAAVVANTKKDIYEAFGLLLGNREKLQQMSKNAKKLSSANASEEIASMIIGSS
jgi:processive 1,2-diacylglycerol beta-glucosyltransferase